MLDSVWTLRWSRSQVTEGCISTGFRFGFASNLGRKEVRSCEDEDPVGLPQVRFAHRNPVLQGVVRANQLVEALKGLAPGDHVGYAQTHHDTQLPGDCQPQAELGTCVKSSEA